MAAGALTLAVGTRTCRLGLLSLPLGRHCGEKGFNGQSHPLEEGGAPLAAADAHGDDSVTGAAAAHFAGDRPDQS